MKLKKIGLLLSGFLTLSAAAQPQINLTNQLPGAEQAPPDKDKLSYAIGMSVGMNITSAIKRQELDVNIDTIMQGVKDLLTGQHPRLTDKEVNDMLRRELPAYLQAKRQAETKKLEAMGEQNKSEGEAFLAKHATADGVKILPDGLQYQVLKEGTGESPSSNDIAHVSYRGTLIDGTEFDKNEDFTTPLTRVIKGWTEALSLMKVGSKWEIVVPANLAYGARAQPPKIAPNSVLVFDMELLDVRHAPARPQSPMANPGFSPPPSHSSAAPGSTNGSVVSGQIIRVPSADELKKGAKIEVIDPSTTNTAGAK